MSLSFPHKSKSEIRQNYNCLGLLWLVPVYAMVWEDTETGELFIDDDIIEANWVPKPLFFIARIISTVYCAILADLGIEPNAPVILLRIWKMEEEEKMS